MGRNELVMTMSLSTSTMTPRGSSDAALQQPRMRVAIDFLLEDDPVLFEASALRRCQAAVEHHELVIMSGEPQRVHEQDRADEELRVRDGEEACLHGRSIHIRSPSTRARLPIAAPAPPSSGGARASSADRYRPATS
jgi:hypothetical protein